MGAVVRHLADVVAAGGIGLGAEQAAVGELAHAQRVGQFDPLVGVGVDRQIPLVHLPGIDARQHGEVAGHHQALNVVGVGLFLGLGDGGPEAGHVGLGGPVEVRQRPVGPEEILFHVARHLQPVDAAHVFAPADDLADEAFGCVQGRPAGVVLVRNPPADRQRVEKTGVDVEGENGMIEEAFSFQHCILVVAEEGEGMLDEVLQGRFGLHFGDGEPEGVQIAEVIAEARVDEVQDVLRDRIGFDLVGLRQEEIGLGRLAVLGIEIPLSAFRLAAIHQQPGLAPHVPIEELHAQLLAPLGPGGEVVA